MDNLSRATDRDMRKYRVLCRKQDAPPSSYSRMNKASQHVTSLKQVRKQNCWLCPGQKVLSFRSDQE